MNYKGILITTDEQFIYTRSSLAKDYQISLLSSATFATGKLSDYVMVTTPNSPDTFSKLNIYASAFKGRPILGNVIVLKIVDGEFCDLTLDDVAEFTDAKIEFFEKLEQQYYD